MAMNIKIWYELDDLEDEHMLIGNTSTYLASESVTYKKNCDLHVWHDR